MSNEAGEGAALQPFDAEEARRFCLSVEQNTGYDYERALARWIYKAAEEIDRLRAQLAAQQAETERLRTALEELAENPGTDGWSRHKAERALLSGGAEEASDASDAS